MRPGMTVRLAPLNIQGMKVVMKREEVESWMIRKHIQVTVVQETTYPPRVWREGRDLLGISLDLKVELGERRVRLLLELLLLSIMSGETT